MRTEQTPSPQSSPSSLKECCPSHSETCAPTRWTRNFLCWSNLSVLKFLFFPQFHIFMYNLSFGERKELPLQLCTSCNWSCHEDSRAERDGCDGTIGWRLEVRGSPVCQLLRWKTSAGNCNHVVTSDSAMWSPHTLNTTFYSVTRDSAVLFSQGDQQI